MDGIDFIIFAGIMCFLFCLMALIAKAKESHDAKQHDNEEIKTRFLD